MEKQYYITREQYLSLKAAWKKLADSGSITPQDIFTYNILRNMNPTKGFSPATGGHIRGNDAWYSYNNAKAIAYQSTPRLQDNQEYRDRKLKRFSERFGIECPEDLHQKIGEIKNER